MKKTVELKTPQDFAIHGNRSRSPSAVLRRRFGKYSNVFVGDRGGTVRDSDGNDWDWWVNDNTESTENIVIVKAR